MWLCLYIDEERDPRLYHDGCAGTGSRLRPLHAAALSPGKRTALAGRSRRLGHRGGVTRKVSAALSDGPCAGLGRSRGGSPCFTDRQLQLREVECLPQATQGVSGKTNLNGGLPSRTDEANHGFEAVLGRPAGFLTDAPACFLGCSWRVCVFPGDGWVGARACSPWGPGCCAAGIRLRSCAKASLMSCLFRRPRGLPC